jgi:hypothetical protein
VAVAAGSVIPKANPGRLGLVETTMTTIAAGVAVAAGSAIRKAIPGPLGLVGTTTTMTAAVAVAAHARAAATTTTMVAAGSATRAATLRRRAAAGRAVASIDQAKGGRPASRAAFHLAYDAAELRLRGSVEEVF